MRIFIASLADKWLLGAMGANREEFIFIAMRQMVDWPGIAEASCPSARSQLLENEQWEGGQPVPAFPRQSITALAFTHLGGTCKYERTSASCRSRSRSGPGPEQVDDPALHGASRSRA